MSTETETTEETTEQVQEDNSFLDMSDDDISNMSEPDSGMPQEEASSETTEDSEGSEESEVIDDLESTTQDSIDEEAADSDSDTSDDSTGETSDDQGTVDVDEGATDTSESSEDSDTKDTVDESKDISDASAQMKKLLSPFKANGKEIQVDNVDDAITLMKMGANYNKKMSALKPNLKIVKMLENEGLLDPEKLNNLIDLSKKNPAAIKQLIKDSGIDPLDIDVKEDTGYTPETYSVNDTEIELDMVLSELKGSTAFSKTMDIISNKFDASSKKVLVESPDIIRVLNEHVELGIYDKIAAVIEKERMVGRLTGLNDLQAYKQVSDGINAKGGMRTETSSTSSENTDADTPATTQQDSKKTKERKKSASLTKSSPGKKSNKSDFNPLSLSDEEIENMPMSKYM